MYRPPPTFAGGGLLCLQLYAALSALLLAPIYGLLLPPHKHKYENYHPVVWLTANDRAGAKNTGLSNDKIMCRITIKTEGKIWRYLPWRAFYDKYNADRSIASTLKQTADDYRNWYVCESEIPVTDFAKVEFLDEDGTYKAENDIPGFSLSDVAPELFD